MGTTARNCREEHRTGPAGRARPPWRPRIFRAAKWAALGSLAYLGINLWQVMAAERTDATQPADCAIILGAAVWPDERPSPTLRERTYRAAAVYHAGYVRHLVPTGGVGDWPPAEAEAMRRLLVQRGVPDEAIILEKHARTTAESATLCAGLMRERGWKSALLVSDPWHLPRSVRLFERLGINAYPCPAFNTPTWQKTDRRIYYTLREAIILSLRRVG